MTVLVAYDFLLFVAMPSKYITSESTYFCAGTTTPININCCFHSTM